MFVVVIKWSHKIGVSYINYALRHRNDCYIINLERAGLTGLSCLCWSNGDATRLLLLDGSGYSCERFTGCCMRASNSRGVRL